MTDPAIKPYESVHGALWHAESAAMPREHNDDGSSFGGALALLQQQLAWNSTTPVRQGQAPGLDTQDSSGRKQAAARNADVREDGSVPDVAALNATELATRSEASPIAQADAAAATDGDTRQSRTRQQPDRAEQGEPAARPSSRTAPSDGRVRPGSSSGGERVDGQPGAARGGDHAAAHSATDASGAQRAGSSSLVGTASGSRTVRAADTAVAAQAAASAVRTVGGASAPTTAAHASHAAEASAKQTGAFKALLAQGAPVRRSVETQETVQTTVKGMQLLIKDGGGEAVLKLRPGDLGSVLVHVRVQDARVTATLEATTSVARELLMQSTDTLRAALETRGLVVDDLIITGPSSQDVGSESGNGDHRGGAAGEQGPAREASRDSGGSLQFGHPGEDNRDQRLRSDAEWAALGDVSLHAERADEETRAWGEALPHVARGDGFEWIA